jgi:hypothetical protein
MLEAEEKKPNPSKARNVRHQAGPNPSKGRSFDRHQAPPCDPHDKGKLLKDQQEWWREEGDRVGGGEAAPMA